MYPQQSQVTGKPTKPQSRISRLAIRLLLIAVVFALLEGLSSLVLFFYDFSLRPLRSIAEKRYTEYDPLLGWIHQPNLYIPNMFGTNAYLKTNSQRIRADYDFTEKIPDGKIRILCSGDSFTMGYGVSNKQTWCEQLSAIDPTIETVNMGLGGYGADQAYLWYKRDGSRFRHNMQLFTVISYDFDRMKRTTFADYAKPILRAENQKLITENVPVPRRSAARSWLMSRIQSLHDLRTFQLVNRAYSKVSPPESRSTDQQIEPVVSLLIDDLVRVNDDRRSKLVLIFLPTEKDHLDNTQQHWRKFLARLTRQRGIPFLDLCEDFYRLPITTVRRMFIRRGEIDYPGAQGHYTAYGNQLIAGLIYQRLAPYRSANQ